MEYKNPEIRQAAKRLKAKFESLDDKRAILRAPELAALYDRIKELPAGEPRAKYGQEVNTLKNELEQILRQSQQPAAKKLAPIDITAPFDVNVPQGQRPGPLPAQTGSTHPLMAELQRVLDIFYRSRITRN
jgi:phenylalanyl-tRNA synthetase alpha subunit